MSVPYRDLETAAANTGGAMDVELSASRRYPAAHRQPWDVIGMVSLGGAVGGCARYGIAAGVPTGTAGFPWATFLINISGCALIGVLMVLIREVWAAHRLVRPFLGTGVLGGFTTFSTYTVDVQHLATAGRVGTALLYLVGTAAAALVSVALAMAVTRRVATGRLGRRTR